MTKFTPKGYLFNAKELREARISGLESAKIYVERLNKKSALKLIDEDIERAKAEIALLEKAEGKS